MFRNGCERIIQHESGVSMKDNVMEPNILIPKEREKVAWWMAMR